MSGLFAYDLVSLAHPGDIVSVSQAGHTVGGRDSTAMLDLRRLRTGAPMSPPRSIHAWSSATSRRRSTVQIVNRIFRASRMRTDRRISAASCRYRYSDFDPRPGRSSHLPAVL